MYPYGKRAELLVRFQQADPVEGWTSRGASIEEEDAGSVEEGAQGPDGNVRRVRMETLERQILQLSEELGSIRGRPNFEIPVRSAPPRRENIAASMKDIKEMIDYYDGTSNYEIWEGKLQAVRSDFNLTDTETRLLIASSGITPLLNKCR